MALALHSASLDGVDLNTYIYNRNSETEKVAEHLDFEGMSHSKVIQDQLKL